MKGKLIKTSRGWEVEYEEKVPQLHFLAKQTVAIPLHPDDIQEDAMLYPDGYIDEKEVEFEVVTCCPNGDEEGGCSYRHPHEKFAKLIFTKQEESSNWDEIEILLKPYISFDDLYEIMKKIEKNYLPPIKR